jgi:hypothetical protein
MYAVEMTLDGMTNTKFGDQFRNSSNIKDITSTVWEAIVLALLLRRISYVSRWDGLKWHDIYTKSHDNQFRHSSNVKGITSTIWVPIVLVLSMRKMYDVRHWDDFMWHYIHTKFHEDWCRRSSNIKVLPQKFESLSCWYYWLKGTTNAPLRLLHVAWHTY